MPIRIPKLQDPDVFRKTPEVQEIPTRKERVARAVPVVPANLERNKELCSPIRDPRCPFTGWKTGGGISEEVILRNALENINGPRLVALLANGPSLVDHWSNGNRRKYDFVVAVNTAAWLFDSDFHCFLDGGLWNPDTVAYPGQVARRPRLAYVTHESMRIDRPHARLIPEGYGKKPLPGWGAGIEGGIGSLNWTFPVALNLANHLANSGHVDVYGFDVAIGQGDVVGKGGNRKNNRWFKELFWIRHFWDRARTECYGRASDEILEFCCGAMGEQELMRYLGIRIINPDTMKEELP